MAEALLGHRSYVAEFDALLDLLVLTAQTPGPAGSLVVELRGVRFGLDAADPGLVNFVEVERASTELVDTPAPSLPRRLLGDVVCDEAGSVVGAARSMARRIGDTGLARDAAVPTRVARLATVLAGATLPGLLPAESALAVLEAYSLARRLGIENDLAQADGGERDVDDGGIERAIEAMLAGADRLIAELDSAGRSVAADVCDDTATSGSARNHTAALTELATRLRRTVAAPSNSPGHQSPWMDSAVNSNAIELGERLAPDALPLLVAAREPTVSRTSNDEIEVRLAGWGERTAGWWVRTFRPSGHVPLAIVPMRDEGGDAVARLLIAPHDAATFEVDIVDDPAGARPSARVAAFRAAIASGQRAARLERLDRRDEAVHAWARSGELHRQAGDDDRARQADAIAQDQRASSLPRSSLRVGATLADRFTPTT